MTHAALLYRNHEHLGAVAADFARRGAEAGEPLLVLLPPPSYDVVRSALGETGAEIQFEDISERGANPSRLLEVMDDWIEAHDGPVRVIDEPVWPGRRQAEIVEVLRHEALVNHALASSSVSILSPYDRANLDADALEGAELTHPQVIRNGVPHPSDLYGDPLDLYAGTRWPQPPGNEPISEIAFTGDLHVLREAISGDIIAAGLRRERRADLVFVVNEAATNAVQHGDGNCTARLWHDGDTVVSEVSTTSRLTDALAGRRRPPQGTPGGRGLWLINQLCNLVELRSGETGTTLRMHLHN